MGERFDTQIGVDGAESQQLLGKVTGKGKVLFCHRASEGAGE